MKKLFLAFTLCIAIATHPGKKPQLPKKIKKKIIVKKTIGKKLLKTMNALPFNKETDHPLVFVYLMRTGNEELATQYLQSLGPGKKLECQTHWEDVKKQ